MEKKIDYMTSEVLELKNTIEQLQNPTIRETMKSITEDKIFDFISLNCFFPLSTVFFIFSKRMCESV